MAQPKSSTNLDIAMRLLGLSARGLSAACGISFSLVARWQKGARPLTARSKAVPRMAEALLRLDTGGALAPLLAPYSTRGQSPHAALCEYLTSTAPALPVGAAPATVQKSGEYEVRYRVYLGQKGFYKVALANVEHLASVPPGLELGALCTGSYEWFTGSIPFLLQFLTGVRRAVARGGRFLVIIRKGYTATETALFAGPWLLFHLRGYIRSRYYDDELPAGVRFVASIPGYLGTWVEADDSAEDGMRSELHGDARSMRRCQAAIEEYRAKSRPSSQYGFLHRPAGGKENPRLWREGPLPAWTPGAGNETPTPPTGSFCALCRTPALGVMSRGEFARIAGAAAEPALAKLPEYLFSGGGAGGEGARAGEGGGFAKGPHRIMLCREDVRAALSGTRSKQNVLSAILHKRAFVPQEVQAAMLRRLLYAMEHRADFEIALIPRVAFEKLQLEMVCWQNSVSVAWLQDMEESVFADEAPTSGSFYGFLEVVWDKLLAGWKRKATVGRTLRKWLAGKELDAALADSAIVQNWDVLPEEAS